MVSALIEASGLPADEWVRRWLDAYLLPVVHCLTVHDLVFMPHGENLVLVVRDGAVVRAVMKDIGEEAAVLGRHDDRPVPADNRPDRAPGADDEAALAVFTDVFDGVLRFVAAILDDDGYCRRAGSGGRGECTDAHAAAHPDRRRPLDLRCRRSNTRA